jgi:hypothetical protein
LIFPDQLKPVLLSRDHKLNIEVALMAEAKPFWSALYRSLILTEREDYEYRRGSIYKNISAIYRIKDDGQNILKVNDCWPGTELNRRRQRFQGCVLPAYPLGYSKT